mmetsp:Transcript_14772/g.30047  ORF Transcript_14772/g.30047 Transcript_14772/m.30047 type:complete len:105 (-) Transcript_14772:347-661(-)
MEEDNKPVDSSAAGNGMESREPGNEGVAAPGDLPAQQHAQDEPDVLDEDDDFEEFEEEAWDIPMGDKPDEHEWEDTWDDEELADDGFVDQLRQELSAGNVTATS